MLYLVRHGQTDWNLFRRANGITETFLNMTGLEQAARLSERLKEVHFDACFCSPQQRARQYCEIICKEPAVFDERLTEINCGAFEGLEETPEMMKRAAQAIYNGDNGTERMDLFIKRNCDFCDFLKEKYKGKDVLVVTHAWNTRVFDYYFNGKPADYDFFQRVVDSGEVIQLEN